ncbi:MAG: DUF4351 domain-containing protein, partial [Cyanobacteriota bacterium SKYGB_h_bin112]|nr:DUF4351 domain-containing protein [Cyanobacteriota bacterium SKYGB_h_bin112]
MIDHDRLFKELLTTFFWEFLQLFCPEVTTYIDPDSLTFLDKEVFTDVTAGAKYATDLLVRAKFREQEAYFLIHLEHQAQPQPAFNKRMFRYFARLHETYDRPIYPIVLFSFPEPRTLQPRHYEVTFPDGTILQFNYRVIQLNQLNWRDFLQQPNPVASALMARMNIAPADRLRVKVECLRLLATLRLNPAKMQLISGFIDTYLRLSAAEQQAFRAELDTIEPETKEVVMQIITSWMEEGIQQGLQQGRQEGKREEALRTVLRLLNRRFGTLSADRRSQIQTLALLQLEDLTDALLDFTSLADLDQWLHNLATQIDCLTQQITTQLGDLPP